VGAGGGAGAGGDRGDGGGGGDYPDVEEAGWLDERTVAAGGGLPGAAGDGDYGGSYYDYNKRDYYGGPNILKMYLGLEPITLDRSLYKPTSLTKFSDVPLYSISKYTKLDEYLNWNTDFLKRISELKEGEIISGGIIDAIHTKIDLGRGYTVSIGRDKKGVYVSLFDIWDFDYSAENCARGEKDKNILLLIERYLMDKIGKNKIGFYDRFYLNEAAIQREVDSLPPLSK